MTNVTTDELLYTLHDATPDNEGNDWGVAKHVGEVSIRREGHVSDDMNTISVQTKELVLGMRSPVSGRKMELSLSRAEAEALIGVIQGFLDSPVFAPEPASKKEEILSELPENAVYFKDSLDSVYLTDQHNMYIAKTDKGVDDLFWADLARGDKNVAEQFEFLKGTSGPLIKINSWSEVRSHILETKPEPRTNGW